MRAGVGTAAVLGTGPALLGQSGAGNHRSGSLPLLDNAELFLINRATQGFTTTLWDEVQALGYEGYLEQQLDPDSIDDSAVENYIAANWPTVAMTMKEIYDNYWLNDDFDTPIWELKQACVYRSLFSKRQLFERMVEFWTDHWNIWHFDEINIGLKTVDDRDFIRGNAFGSFHTMILRSIRNPAMLIYLDNYLNGVGAIQENHARELLELHTLGVDGPYTEDDIKEVARCLTGRSLNFTVENYGEYEFYNFNHDYGEKTVLGHVIPGGGGKSDGRTVAGILQNHPKTADFISRKMCKWFLGYDPPQILVKKVMMTYMRTQGDIKAMLRVIFDKNNIQLVKPSENPKLRRPYHFVTSLLRSTFAKVQNPLSLVYELYRLGQVPYNWSPPTGFPDSLDAWGSSLMPRWTIASNLIDGNIPGVEIDYLEVLFRLGTPPKTELAQAVNLLMTGGHLDPADVARVQVYVDGQPTFNETLLRETLALVASCPSYQLY